MTAQMYVQNDTSNDDDDEEEDEGKDKEDARMSKPDEVRAEESPASHPSDAESTGNNTGVNPAPPGSQPPGASARSPPATTVVGVNN